MTLEVFQIGTLCMTARPDLDEEISNGNLSVNGRFLDLGTGPATQAVQVSRKGFSVTGFELSRSAVYRAMEVYANE